LLNTRKILNDAVAGKWLPPSWRFWSELPSWPRVAFLPRLPSRRWRGCADRLVGGAKKGDQPGLYGGSSTTKICDKKNLARFLRKPSNRQKAEAWAAVQGIDVEDTGKFVAKLTSVILRNDTLVKNYDYRKGKAIGFDALLEAGIAVLVDSFGQPVVKCSCGNPLGAFEHDVDRVDVQFKGKHKKWRAYHPEKIVTVEPAPENRRVTTYALVDVEKENAGLERAAGADGAKGTPLPEDPGSGARDPDAGTGENPGPRGGGQPGLVAHTDPHRR